MKIKKRRWEEYLQKRTNENKIIKFRRKKQRWEEYHQKRTNENENYKVQKKETKMGRISSKANKSERKF